MPVNKRKFLILVVFLFIGMILPNVFSIPTPHIGSVTPCRNCSFSVPNGTITPIAGNQQFYNNGTGTATNNSITFNVNLVESTEPKVPSLGAGGVVYNVTTTGNITITYRTSQQPQVVCSFCTSSFTGSKEVISYVGAVAFDVLTVAWGGFIFPHEQPKVLLIDEFQTGLLADNNWIIDTYGKPQAQSGIFSASGLLTMNAQPSSSIETIHSLNPAFDPLQYSGQSIVVKRKLTVSLYPFTSKVFPATSDIRIGFTPLIKSGQYPGSTPANTPFADLTTNCVSPDSSSDNIGLDYLAISNSGGVSLVTCGDGSFNRVTNLFSASIDPTLYTVVTVETFGVFCSTCTDNVYPGLSWVWFRMYQEDTSNTVISSTDKNMNFTLNEAPYFQRTFVFLSQTNNDIALNKETTYVSLVQDQNYGSPVCLFGCIPPLDLSGIGPFSSIWASIVSLCQWMGLGDLGLGAFFLFMIISGVVVGATVGVGIRYGSGAPTIVIVAEFIGISAIFLTSGLMGSVWLFAILITDGVVALFTFRSVFLKGGSPGDI